MVGRMRTPGRRPFGHESVPVTSSTLLPQLGFSAPDLFLALVWPVDEVGARPTNEKHTEHKRKYTITNTRMVKKITANIVILTSRGYTSYYNF